MATGKIEVVFNNAFGLELAHAFLKIKLVPLVLPVEFFVLMSAFFLGRTYANAKEPEVEIKACFSLLLEQRSGREG